jgi:hypothetical protein
VTFSLQANYTDWATAICRRNLVPTFVDRGVSRGQRGGSPVVVNLSFLDRKITIITILKAYNWKRAQYGIRFNKFFWIACLHLLFLNTNGSSWNLNNFRILTKLLCSSKVSGSVLASAIKIKKKHYKSIWQCLTTNKSPDDRSRASQNFMCTKYPCDITLGQKIRV